MRVFSVIITILFLSCGIYSCDSNTSKEVDINTSAFAVKVPVTLIDNEPYIANKETTTGINQLLTIVEAGLESEDPNMAQIGIDLEDTIKDIYASCTMSGRPFEELNNYLAIVNDKVQEVKQTPNKIVLIELQSYLSQYPKYFK